MRNSGIHSRKPHETAKIAQRRSFTTMSSQRRVLMIMTDKEISQRNSTGHLDIGNDNGRVIVVMKQQSASKTKVIDTKSPLANLLNFSLLFWRNSRNRFSKETQINPLQFEILHVKT
jgi:hypothetical protein